MSLVNYLLNKAKELEKQEVKRVIPTYETRKQQYKNVFKALINNSENGVVKEFSQTLYSKKLNMKLSALNQTLTKFKKNKIIKQLPSDVKNRPQSFKILSYELPDELIEIFLGGKFKRDNMRLVLDFLKENAIDNSFTGTSKEIAVAIGINSWNVLSASQGLESQGYIYTISRGSGFAKTYIIVGN